MSDERHTKRYRTAPYFTGDGITIEQSINGEPFSSIGYINTGATASTMSLALEIVNKLNGD